jgi:hypothetical protein
VVLQTVGRNSICGVTERADYMHGTHVGDLLLKFRQV